MVFGSQNQKCVLSGALHKKFANLCSGVNTPEWIGGLCGKWIFDFIRINQIVLQSGC